MATLLNRRCCFIINYIKSSTNKSVKNKLLLLYILNISDIIFTLILLQTDMFIEANVTMQKIVLDPILSLVIKVGFVGILVFFVYRRLEDANNQQLKIGNIFVSGMLIVYIIINSFHIIYVMSYIYLNIIPKFS
ncbi:DUF5658 family protein [Clostridium sp. LY3-2]|uniref:DUF5658 family protein n=1 Tax=Clostridium sp. LY3-2 TaxID=2942482 RepID=UPI0035B56AA4